MRSALSLLLCLSLQEKNPLLDPKSPAVNLTAPAEFKVKLGGEYNLELQDAQHGLLTYDARLGFITTQ